MLRNLTPQTLGALSAIAGVFCFSVNDVAIKFLSGGYALHQVVLIRSCIAMVFLFAVIVPFAGGLRALRTRRLPLHLLRGLCVVFANMSFFLGLAALPLAEGVAIFFVSPLVITIFSVVFLRESVGRFRWAAVAVGLIGVVVVLRPGYRGVSACLPVSGRGGAGLCFAAHADAVYRADGIIGGPFLLYPDDVHRGDPRVRHRGG